MTKSYVIMSKMQFFWSPNSERKAKRFLLEEFIE